MRNFLRHGDRELEIIWWHDSPHRHAFLEFRDRFEAEKFLWETIMEADNGPVLRRFLADDSMGLRDVSRLCDDELIELLAERLAAGEVRVGDPLRTADYFPVAKGNKEVPKGGKGGGGGQPVPPKKDKKVWIKIRVVEDATDQPISGVPLKVLLPGGAETLRTTGADGLIDIENIDPGACAAQSKIQGVTKPKALEFVKMGAAGGAAPGAAANAAGDLSGGVVAVVEHHKVKTGETIDSLAKGAGMTWKELARFNWGTDVPEQINQHLRDEVGCTQKTADGNNYMFDNSDNPGIVLIPRDWSRDGLQTEQEHIVRVKRLAAVAVATFGVTRLEVPEYLASGLPADQEPFTITYEINDPAGMTTEARLELFRKGNDQAPVWTGMLEAKDYTHGVHQRPWDGKMDAAAGDFPDGYVTVEHSPYKLRISIKGNGVPAPGSQEGAFKVEVVEIKMELGLKETLTEDRDKKLYDKIGSLPAAGEKREVKLISNIFKIANGEMEDNTSFDQYKTAWSDGPNIPIFAKAWVKNSQSNKVLAPKALGRVKFLWDWEDIPEDTSVHHAKAKVFLDNALDYYKPTTKPKGDNCHLDRGGKRDGGAKPVFPPHPGYGPAAALTAGQFPFKVEACSIRKWVAFSQAWTGGVLGSMTGVMFQPARMAGDGFKLTVYLANEKKEDGSIKIDVENDPPLDAPIQDVSGAFILWREIHLIKYTRKNNVVPAFNVASFQGYYEKASIRVEDKSTAGETMAEADYNAKFTTAVNGMAWYKRSAYDSTANQYTNGAHAVTFRSFNGFKNQVKADKAWTDAQLNTWLAGPGSAINTSSKYHKFCKDWAKEIVIAACDGYIHADQGINILHFQGLYNLETSPGGVTLNGFAPSFASTNRNKCAFVQCAGAGNYGGDSNSAEQTITHEIGHHLFLPHAPFPTASVPAGAKENRHDKDWANCIMSYDYSAERKFCGLCILRLRGWDGDQLDKDAALNKKP